MTLIPILIKVRLALTGDVAACKGIADSNRNVFGFLTRAVFGEAAERQGLLVATFGEDDEVIGFLRFRHRARDRGTSLYDIAVATHAQRCGVGRALVRALTECSRNADRSEIRLRCPEGAAANHFYEAIGFAYGGHEEGRRRRLIVWSLDLRGPAAPALS